MAADPRVSLLVVDPDDTSRYTQVRGDAELVESGALEHLDRLTRKYTRHPRFDGRVYPVEQQGPRDPGDLPDPRPPDHAGRDPPLRAGTAAPFAAPGSSAAAGTADAPGMLT
jgi:hypothetical protein